MADLKITIAADTSGVASGAAAAEQTLSGFAGRARSLGTVVTGSLLGLGMQAVQMAKDAAVAMGTFLKESIEEAANAERSVAGLRVALGNAGASYRELEAPINRVVDGLARQTKFTDDDLRNALTNLVRTTGDVKGSMANLSVVTDLAVAKNMDLGAASDLVGKAMAGNTTALTKLFPELKGSSDAVAELGRMLKGTAEADASTFGGKMDQLFKQFGEVKEAIGGVVTGSGFLSQALENGATVLEKLAGWIGRNAENLRAFFAAAGDVVLSLVDIGRAIWNTVAPALGEGGVGGLLVRVGGLLGEAAAGFKGFAGAGLLAIGAVQEKLGAFIEGAGNVLRAFGIKVGTSWGTTLRETGARALDEGARLLEQSRVQHERAWEQLKTGHRAAQEAQTRVTAEETDKQTTKHKAATDAKVADEGKVTRVLELEGKKRETLTAAELAELQGLHLEMEANRQKAAKESGEVFLKVNKLLNDINLKAHKEQWEEIDRNVRQVKGDLSDLLPPISDIKAEIDKNNDALKRNKDSAKQVKEEFQQTVDGAVQIGRSLLDVAQASGAVSREMGSVLNSVLNIGSSLARIGIDPLGGIVGVLGGLANVITGIGNSEAHKAMRAALAQNRDALDRLSREVGNFNLNASGNQIEGISKAIDATSAANAAGQFGSGPQGDIKAFTFFLNELGKAGIKPQDALAILSSLGFDVNNPAKFRQGLSLVQSGLGQLEFGQFGQDFESQFGAITRGFDIFGIEDPSQQLAQFASLGKFSPAIAAALNATDQKAALRDLFRKLQTGGLAAADFGDLTPQQFLDFLTTLLGLFDQGGTLPITGGLDPGTIEDGIGFPSSPPPSGGSGPFGTAPNIGTITIDIASLGTFTLAPDGQSVDEIVPELAERVSRELVRRFAAQSAAQGVPI